MKRHRTRKNHLCTKSAARLAAVTATALIASLSGSQTRADTLKDVFTISQKNELLGHVDIYVAPDRVKALVQNGELLLLSSAPDWNVTAYRKKANLGLQQSLAQFAHDGIKVMGVTENLRNATLNNQFDPVLKTDCREQVVKCHGRYYGVNDPTIFQASKKLFLKEMHFKTSRSIPVDPNVHKFLQGLFNMHTFDGVPLELAYCCTDGSVDRIFFTQSIKREKVPESFFTQPAKFKTVDMRTILMPPAQRGQFEALLHDVIEEEKEADREKLKAQPHHK